MKIRFFLRNGATIEWPVPEDMAAQFNFAALCKAIRADGHFVSPDLHIPYEHIAAIALMSDGASAIMMPGTTRRQ